MSRLQCMTFQGSLHWNCNLHPQVQSAGHKDDSLLTSRGLTRAPPRRNVVSSPQDLYFGLGEHIAPRCSDWQLGLR